MALGFKVPAHPSHQPLSHGLIAGVVLFAMLGVIPTAIAQDGEANRLGRVSFPVSCTPEAQRRFEHAMAVLHSFWWEEGERVFDAVIEADSTCAMAHWGRALNAWGNPFAGGPSGAALAHGTEAAARAAARPLPTPREQGFVNAVAALRGDGVRPELAIARAFLRQR